ncbi:geranylgeranyl transferase type II alpha subunit [Scheffersomyces coipomensis]|uniref:geranylgeranyl transferase type II alpha subunit n=1 Tax=Scheffersomyces coipomensis TaxID=1788519 RepID=UPI00315C56D1
MTNNDSKREHGVKRVNLSKEAKRLKLERDAAKTENYKALTSQLFTSRDDHQLGLSEFNETTKILLINPEFYTMWNYRREVLIELRKSIEVEQYIDMINRDLKLLMDLLKRYPKCYWIWNHRRWCLFELVELNKVNWEYEFGVVSKLLELDARNYHGWQYRRFVVQNIEQDSLKKKKESQSETLILLNINANEFNYTTTKIKKNISNFSAWHNRSKLIPKVFKYFSEVSDIPEPLQELYKTVFQSPHLILVHDLELIKTGMYMDSDDTSVWLYLYWLLTEEFFIKDLTKEVYLSILKEQLSIIEELNELEKDDHKDHWDHCWCLKSIVFVKVLIYKQSNEDALSDDIKAHLKDLIKIDPLRKAKYLDQLEGKVSII